MNVAAPLFTPTEADLAWCRMLTRIIRDGGTWVTSTDVYTVDKQTKRLIRIGSRWPEGDNHKRNKVVFGAIGWEVLP